MENAKTKQIKERYTLLAEGKQPSAADPILSFEGCILPTKTGYTQQEMDAVPPDARKNLGCGIPLHCLPVGEGQTVVDLGCGSGIDCFLASQKVGPSGRVYGIDITEEMLLHARQNALEGHFTNVEFLLGDASDVPLPDGIADFIVSNCVINLIDDKDRVFRECRRLLKPSGMICLSDIVILKDPSGRIRRTPKSYASCLVGAITKESYLAKLETAGFTDVTVQNLKSWPFMNNYAAMMVTACLK